VTAYTWNSLQAAVQTSLVQGASLPADFTTLFPSATSYAEGRIGRDLVLLNTRLTDQSLFTVSGSNTLPALSAMPVPLTVVEGVALVQNGVAYEYDKTSLDVIDLFWPSQTLTLSPAAAEWIGRYWAMYQDQYIILSPTPDGVYNANVTGLFIQTPMSNANQNTYIGTVYGDLMFCAVMIFMHGGLTRNFGAQADEPRAAQSWENQYQTLFPGCEAEEARRRGLTVDDLRAKREMMAAQAQPQAA
jgi:hypothetical protein